MPPPGIEPGRPNWTRECKSRLSANSSTGAYAALDAVAGWAFDRLPAPAWFFRPSSAALLPLPSCSPFFSGLSNKREQTVGDLPSFPESGIRKPILLAPPRTDYDHIAIPSVSRKHLPNYLNEFQFRWNTRKLDDGQRVAQAIKAVDGKRLQYRESVDRPPYIPQPKGQMEAPFEAKP